MLSFAAPILVHGSLLSEQLASAGVPSDVVLHDGQIHLVDLDEADRTLARAVVDAHSATAQVELDRTALERSNQDTIRQRADAALSTNATFLALPAPTNAQIAAQVKALTRQNNGLIRLALSRFDSAD